MSISYKSPVDDDGFFNFFNGTTRNGVGVWDECMYVMDPETDDAFDDVELVKPLRPEDRISLMITATEADAKKLDETLRSMAPQDGESK